MKYMLGVATLTSILYAWRKRDRQHAILAAFFGLTLSIDLLRAQLRGVPPGSLDWYVNVLSGMMQIASVPALAAVILARRRAWLAVAGWVVAAVFLIALPHRLDPLLTASDIAAIIGSLAYAAIWARTSIRDMTLAELAALLVIGVTAVGLVGHTTLIGPTQAWRIHSAVNTCILAGIATAQLRGALR